LDANPERISGAKSQALGRLQWARNSSKPENTYADFAQSIIELREVSQLVGGRAKSLVSALAAGYLIYEFGWKPIISDVQKLANLARAVQKKIDFLKNNEGKVVKRTRVLYNISRSLGEIGIREFGTPYPWGGTVEPAEGSHPIYGTANYKAAYHTSIRYVLPGIDRLTWNEEAFQYLIGLRPGLNLVWDVTPFTWLIDWFNNLGDLIENDWQPRLTEYTQNEEWITVTCSITSTLRIPTVTGGSSNRKAHTSARAERTDTFKYRMIPPKDAPFQPWDLTGFSAKQQAILLALLLSYK
jgi:hypothetical protein